MVARIEFVFEDPATVLEVVLLEDAAPKTCAAVRDVLPVTGDLEHANYSGTVVGLLIDAGIVIPMENATTYTQTGDVMYTHYDALTRYGHPEAVSEIYVAYDRFARPTMPGVGIPAVANVFGRVVGDPEPFYAACRQLMVDRSREVTVRRAR